MTENNQSAVPVSQRAREAAGGNNPVTDRAREAAAKWFDCAISEVRDSNSLAQAFAAFERDILAGQSVGELPLNIEFAAAYLDGVMEGEQPEIAKQWRIIRKHLAATPASECTTEVDALRAENARTLRMFKQYIKHRDFAAAAMMRATHRTGGTATHEREVANHDRHLDAADGLAASIRSALNDATDQEAK